ncbi:MAG: 2Fe-2S iron-sulfur cluster-binding protein [Rhodoferax sp.]|nr:2Fe-2S iron-sulfur cluster-binding protein [Rhodoferax sp.]
MTAHPEAPSELTQTAGATWAGYRSFHVERKELEDAAAQVCSFYLVPEDGKPLAPFLPGQFLTFALDVPSPMGGTQAVIRCYSLSDAPQAKGYRISVKRAAAPVGSQLPPGISSNYFHDHVDVGSQLQVRAPAGHFYLDRSDAPVVLMGGGIGITPLLSMLNWCLTAQPERELWLFYGVRNRAELVMPAQLQALATKHANFHLHLCLSNPQAGEPGADRSEPFHTHHSRVDVALLRRLLPLKPYHFYLCGPTPMLQSLVPALEDWGVPEGRIHFEAFGPASIARKKPVSATLTTNQSDDKRNAVMVNFAKSGKQAAWEPGMGSLLDFAESHGIVVSSGCRAGACGSCQTSIRTGEVAYTQAPDFDPEPGSCLLCVCTPKTAVTLEA